MDSKTEQEIAEEQFAQVGEETKKLLNDIQITLRSHFPSFVLSVKTPGKDGVAATARYGTPEDGVWLAQIGLNQAVSAILVAVEGMQMKVAVMEEKEKANERRIIT